LKDVKQTLELHDWVDGTPYYIGIFLTGAYQEVMGNHHNLFGHPSEAQVAIEADGRFHVTKIVQGSKIQDMLQFARYDKAQLAESYRKMVEQQVTKGVLTAEIAEKLAQEYAADSMSSTYLD
jgi:arginine decarboxylase